MTIYGDFGIKRRKRRAAEQMIELHKERSANDRSVVDVEPYLENGDLQSVYVSYVGRN